MTANKVEPDLAYVAEHAQAIRLVSAGGAQTIALLLIITAPFDFVYGGREFWTVILMLVATGLSTWSLLVHHSQRGKPGE